MFLDSLTLPLMGTQLSYIQMYIKGWAIKRLDLQERSMLTDQVHRALSPRGPPVPPHIGRARRVSRGHTTVGLRGVYDFAWLLILPSNSITCLLHLSNSFLSSAFLSAPPIPQHCNFWSSCLSESGVCSWFIHDWVLHYPEENHDLSKYRTLLSLICHIKFKIPSPNQKLDLLTLFIL